MNKDSQKSVIGLDFGSDSVRAVVVSVETGTELGCGVANYSRWMKGAFCDPSNSQFRHHPQDYIDAMAEAVKAALTAADGVYGNVVGIGVDTTGSTPAPVDSEGTVLALKPEFASNPNAMFILWKDHTAVTMAEKINQLARSGDHHDYTRYVGGMYSSEWYWAKAAWVSEQDKKVHREAYTWVELCDWIPALLTNSTHPERIKRSVCAAGHKALWHEDWNGLPPQEFLSAISNTLDGQREKYSKEVYTSDQIAGYLSKDWAENLGLPQGIAVAVGGFDCHMGAVGANAKPHDFIKVMGTSTCDILMVEPEELGSRVIEGICGQVKGSSLPEYVCLEAGQSAFGDIYAWYKRILSWPLEQWVEEHPEDWEVMKKVEESLLPMLTHSVSRRQPLDGSIALDWLNGRRTPYANQRLTGTISNVNLGTDAPELFHSLVESTAFGAKAIAECLTDQGININRVIAIGGISKKSSLVMQICSDVMGYEIAVVESDQCCARGAAIFAAVAAHCYDSTLQAQSVMASRVQQVYHPRLSRKAHYEHRYNAYLKLGEAMEALTMGNTFHEVAIDENKSFQEEVA